MHSFASIFEIPALDLNRAVDFYRTVLAIPIEIMDIPDLNMALFPYEGETTVAVIVEGEGYVPSSKGITLYLNAGDDLGEALSKVEANGGQILVGKTPHADESGFFALFLDTEGNRLGLHSPN